MPLRRAKPSASCATPLASCAKPLASCAAALVLAVSLSGCSDEGDASAGTTTTTSASDGAGAARASMTVAGVRSWGSTRASVCVPPG